MSKLWKLFIYLLLKFLRNFIARKHNFPYPTTLATIIPKMKIQGFGIKNYRSFNEKGVTLDKLKKINVIIGKNNCGKSNVLRFLQTLN